MDMHRSYTSRLQFVGVLYSILLSMAFVSGNIISVAVTGPPPLRLHAVAAVQGSSAGNSFNRIFIHGGFDGVTHLCKRELWSQACDTGVWHLDSHPTIDEVLPASHFGHSLSALAIRQLPRGAVSGAGGPTEESVSQAAWGPYPALVMFGGSRCVSGDAADADVWVWRRSRDGVERDPAGKRGPEEAGGAGTWTLVGAGGAKWALAPSPRMGHTAVAFDSRKTAAASAAGEDVGDRWPDQLLVFGGGGDGGGDDWMAQPSNELWSLEISDMGELAAGDTSAPEGTLVATWRQLADAPLPLVWHIAVAYRDHAMLVHGGETYGAGDSLRLEPSGVLMLYNATSDVWSTLPMSLKARSRHFAFAMGDLLYVQGGLQVTADWENEVYDASRAAWSNTGVKSASLQPSSLVDAASAQLADGSLGWVFGGAYVLGSSHPSLDPSTLTWRWEATNASWRVLDGGVPAPRVNAALVSAGDSAYLYGGLSISVGVVESCPRVRQQRFDFGEMWRFHDNRWTRLFDAAGGPFPGRRYGHAMEAIVEPPSPGVATNSSARPRTTLVMFGGRSLQQGAGLCVSTYNTDMWVYEVWDLTSSNGSGIAAESEAPFMLDGSGSRREAGMWRQLSMRGEAPIGREGHSLTLLYSGDASGLPGGPVYPRIILFGGQRDSDSGDDVTYFSDVWELNVATSTWRPVRGPGMTPGPLARSSHVCAGTGSLLFCYGGQVAQGIALGDLWKLELSASRWTRLMDGVVAKAGQWPGVRMAASLAPIWPPASSAPSSLPSPPQPKGFLLFGGHRSWGGRGLSDMWLLSPLCGEDDNDGHTWSLLWPSRPDNLTAPLDASEDALGGVPIASLAPEGLFLHHAAVLSSASGSELVIMGGLIQPEDGPYIDSFNYGTWSFNFSDCGLAHEGHCVADARCLRPRETRDIRVDVVEEDEGRADGFRVVVLFLDDANGNTIAEVSTDEDLVTAAGVQERNVGHRSQLTFRRVGVPALGRRTVSVHGAVDAAPLEQAEVDLDATLEGDAEGVSVAGNISLMLYTPRRRTLRVSVFYRSKAAPMPGVRVVVEGITAEASIVSGTVGVQPAAWTDAAGQVSFSVFPNAGARVGYILHFSAARAPEGEVSAVRTNVFVIDTEAVTELEQVMDVAKPSAPGGGAVTTEVFVSVNLLYFDAGPPFRWPSLFAWLRGRSRKGDTISRTSGTFQTNDALDAPFAIATERSTLLQGVPAGNYTVAIWEGSPGAARDSLIRVSEERPISVAPGNTTAQHSVGAVISFFLPMMLVRMQLRYPPEKQGSASGTEGFYPVGGAYALFYASGEDPDSPQGIPVKLVRGNDEGCLTSTTGYVSIYVFTSLWLQVTFAGGDGHEIELGQGVVSPAELDMSRRSLTVAALAKRRQLCNGLAKLSDSKGWFPRRLPNHPVFSPFFYSANVPTCVWLIAPSAVTIEITLFFYFPDGSLSLAAGDEILIKDGGSLVQQMVQAPTALTPPSSPIYRQRVTVHSSSVQIVLRTRNNSPGGHGFVVEYQTRTVRFVDFVLLTVITIITVVGVLLCCLGCCVWTRCYRAFCMDLSMRMISYLPGRQHLLPLATRVHHQRGDPRRMAPEDARLRVQMQMERVSRRRRPSEAAAMLDHVAMLVYKKGVTQLSDDTCSICLCDYEDGELVSRLCCQHAFHRRCLATWLQSELDNRVFICPFCKSVVKFEAQPQRPIFSLVPKERGEPSGTGSAAASAQPASAESDAPTQGGAVSYGEGGPDASSQVSTDVDHWPPPPHLPHASNAEDVLPQLGGPSSSRSLPHGEEALGLASVPLIITEANWEAGSEDGHGHDIQQQGWIREVSPTSPSQGT